MSRIIDREPDYRCVFEGTNNTLLTAYPWTSPRDKRPGTNQWVKAVSASGYTETLKLNNANQCIGGNNGDLYANYYLEIGAPVKKIRAQFKHTGADVFDGVSINLRDAGLDPDIVYLLVQNYVSSTGPTVRTLRIAEGATLINSVVTTSVDISTALHEMTIVDTGTDIIACMDGVCCTGTTSAGYGNTRIQISMSSPAALGILDNLEIWI